MAKKITDPTLIAKLDSARKVTDPNLIEKLDRATSETGAKKKYGRFGRFFGRFKRACQAFIAEWKS